MIRLQGKEQYISLLLRAAVTIAAAVTAGGFLAVAGYFLTRGIPELAMNFFAYRYADSDGSIFPALMTTVYLTAVVLAVAVPLGVGTAVWTTEYLRRGALYSGIRLLTDTLNGLPSILYGLFGFFVFVIGLRMGYSMLAGMVIMVILMLPLIIRTSEEALLAVPDSYRQTGAAMGIGKWLVIRYVILPQAGPGIAAGVILAMGRMAGAAAALIYTAGTVPRMPESFMDSGRTLAVHVYMLFSENISETRVYAAATVLLIVTGVMTVLAECVGRRFRHD